MDTRYHISLNGDHIDQARTRTGAFTKAVYQAKCKGARVRVLDRMAHRGRADLFEFRPFEEFVRVVRVKY